MAHAPQSTPFLAPAGDADAEFIPDCLLTRCSSYLLASGIARTHARPARLAW